MRKVKKIVISCFFMREIAKISCISHISCMGEISYQFFCINQLVTRFIAKNCVSAFSRFLHFSTLTKTFYRTCLLQTRLKCALKSFSHENKRYETISALQIECHFKIICLFRTPELTKFLRYSRI